MILTLGDLNAYALDALRDFDGPKLGVYGNHCDGVYLEDLGCVNLHGRAGTCRGLRFGGHEGCLPYKQVGFGMHTEQEIERTLAPMPRVDVMVCHAPPAGINDEPCSRSHRGLIALREYIDRCPPQMLLHGHTAPMQPITRYRETQIVYVCGHAMVDLPARSQVS